MKINNNPSNKNKDSIWIFILNDRTITERTLCLNLTTLNNRTVTIFKLNLFFRVINMTTAYFLAIVIMNINLYFYFLKKKLFLTQAKCGAIPN